MADISKKRTWIWVAVISLLLVGMGVGVGIPLYRFLTAPEPPEVINITVQEVKEMIDDNVNYPNLIVLDIRLDFEYMTDHLEDSWWIPWNTTTLSYNGGEIALNGYENIEIIVYCRTGSRSASGSQFLVNAGFTEIYNMLGGIEAWRAAGYPTAT